MKRNATAHWRGTGKDGKGLLDTQSKVLDGTPYSYHTRFEEGKGTNPEELIAAAHAGCFTMQLAFNMEKAGHTADEIETRCTITLEEGTITQSFLEVRAKAAGLQDQAFQELVSHAEKNCPVSKVLNAKIQVTARLDM